MDMNSIETASLDAMVAEQDLLDWLDADETVEPLEEPSDQPMTTYA